jgi:hypothetical protein
VNDAFFKNLKKIAPFKNNAGSYMVRFGHPLTQRKRRKACEYKYMS